MSLPSRAIIYDGDTKVGDVFVNCGWWVDRIGVYNTMRNNIIGVNGMPYWTHATAYDITFTKEQLHDENFRETIIVKHAKTRDDGRTDFKPIEMALTRKHNPRLLADEIVGIPFHEVFAEKLVSVQLMEIPIKLDNGKVE